MSSAPLSTPFLTTDQNGSEACPWVTTAILMSFRSAPPPPWVPPCSSAQATSANRAATSNRIQPPILDLLISLLSLEAHRPAFFARRQAMTPPSARRRASSSDLRQPHRPSLREREVGGHRYPERL